MKEQGPRRSFGNAKTATEDLAQWKVLYYSPIATSSSTGDFASTLRQGPLYVKDTFQQEREKAKALRMLELIKMKEVGSNRNTNFSPP